MRDTFFVWCYWCEQSLESGRIDVKKQPLPRGKLETAGGVIQSLHEPVMFPTAVLYIFFNYLKNSDLNLTTE